MDIVLFDGVGHKQLWPLTATKPVSELRVGIFKIREKWESSIGGNVEVRTKDYLSEKFTSTNTRAKIGVYGGAMPNPEFVKALALLKENEILSKDGMVVGISPLPGIDEDMDAMLEGMKVIEFEGDLNVVAQPWDIFSLNGVEITRDFEQIKSDRVPASISSTNTIIGDQVFIEEGAKVECAILNSTTGPIFIENGAEVMEGSIIRGGFALLEGGVVKMSAKIYGPTTIGPYCKVGGEISNSVFQGYSNKGHDGFVGNSVIGEWCNFGADTNTSNLKNNYGNVRVWNELEEDLVESDQMFCGTIMGDHAKTGINTMLNTGTSVGVFANVFGGGFPSKHIPDFAWGGADGFEAFDFDKSLEVAERVMSRRSVPLQEKDINILKHIFDNSRIQNTEE